MGFYMNGDLWHVEYVEADNPVLIDRTGAITLATTSPRNRTIYLCRYLKGEMLSHVLIHELGHAAMVSYGLLDDLHRMVKRRYWIEAEESVCNLIADYGYEIIEIAEHLLGSRFVGVHSRFTA